MSSDYSTSTESECSTELNRQADTVLGAVISILWVSLTCYVVCTLSSLCCVDESTSWLPRPAQVARFYRVAGYIHVAAVVTAVLVYFPRCPDRTSCLQCSGEIILKCFFFPALVSLYGFRWYCYARKLSRLAQHHLALGESTASGADTRGMFAVIPTVEGRVILTTIPEARIVDEESILTVIPQAKVVEPKESLKLTKNYESIKSADIV
jgi:hypothetical protein